jgi:hypothetical protein
MSELQTKALRLLSRKRGATIEELQAQLSMPSPGAARGMITRLKQRGKTIKNVGPSRFQAIAA